MNKQTGSIFTLSRAASSLAYMFRWNIPGTISICNSLMAGKPLLWSEGCWHEEQLLKSMCVADQTTISADAPAKQHCQLQQHANVELCRMCCDDLIFLIFNLSHFLLDFGGGDDGSMIKIWQHAAVSINLVLKLNSEHIQLQPIWGQKHCDHLLSIQSCLMRLCMY